MVPITCKIISFYALNIKKSFEFMEEVKTIGMSLIHLKIKTFLNGYLITFLPIHLMAKYLKKN